MILTQMMSNRMMKEGQCRMKMMKKTRKMMLLRKGMVSSQMKRVPPRWASCEGYQASATQPIWYLASGLQRV